MVKEYRFEIPDIHPSLNSYIKKHWSVYQYHKQIWNKMVWGIVKKEKIPLIQNPVEIHIDYFGPKKVDLDNLVPKLLLDSLKEIVILDDNPDILKKISWTFTKDKNKRSVVLIKLVD